MGKIRIHGKNRIYTVKNFTKYPEEVNVLLLQSINRGDIPGVLQIQYESYGRKAELTITVRNCEPLSLYLAPPASAENFVDAMLRIALILKELDARQMNLGNLDLQLDRIFVNPVSKELYCIYWPTANNTEEHAPQEFLSRVPVRLQFKSYSAKQYIDPYLAFFSNGQPFSVRAFERKMQEIAAMLPSVDKPPVPAAPPVPSVPPVPPPVPYIPPVPPVPNKPPVRNTRPAPFPGISGETAASNTETIQIDSGGSINGGNSGIEYVPPTDDGVAGSFGGGLGANPASGGNSGWGQTTAPTAGSGFGRMTNDTEKFADGFVNPVGQPWTAYLTLMRTGEYRIINSDVFRIGTGQSCGFRTANPYVSHLHAEIRRRGMRYFLVDLQSLNGTFIDGIRIPRGGEVEIRNGTHFVCATEEFVFSVEAR